MRGDEHYREAEDLLKEAEGAEGGSIAERYYLDAAQVHATLAHTAAVIEAADRISNGDGMRDLVIRPMPASTGDPAFPGTPWGRAFYGDRHLDTVQED